MIRVWNPIKAPPRMTPLGECSSALAKTGSRTGLQTLRRAAASSILICGGSTCEPSQTGKNDLSGQGLRVAVKDSEGGQAIAQTLLIADKNVVRVEWHDLDKLASNQP